MPDTYGAVTEKNWNAKHTRVLVGAYRGKDDKQIAISVGLKASTIQHIRKAPYFRQRLQAMANETVKHTLEREIKEGVGCEARKKLEAAQLQAANKIIKLMRRGETTDRMQFEAAKDILDRTGLKAIEVIETRERSYTPEEVERAKTTLNEVENIIMRLENKDSRFLLARQVRTTETTLPSSSVTDKGSDEQTQKDADADPE